MPQYIPERNEQGTIIGMRDASDRSQVATLLEDTMKAVGATSTSDTPTSPPPHPSSSQLDTRTTAALIGVFVLFVMAVFAAATSVSEPMHPLLYPTATIPPTLVPQPTHTPTALPTPAPTETPKPTPVPLPTSEPIPTAEPIVYYCADRESIWGKTHQCATSQSEADALAESIIGQVNATAEAIRSKP